MDPRTTEIVDQLMELGVPRAALTGALGFLAMAKDKISEESLDEEEIGHMNRLLLCIELEARKLRMRLPGVKVGTVKENALRDVYCGEPLPAPAFLS